MGLGRSHCEAPWEALGDPLGRIYHWEYNCLGGLPGKDCLGPLGRTPLEDSLEGHRIPVQARILP